MTWRWSWMKGWREDAENQRHIANQLRQHVENEKKRAFYHQGRWEYLRANFYRLLGEQIKYYLKSIIDHEPYFAPNGEVWSFELSCLQQRLLNPDAQTKRPCKVCAHKWLERVMEFQEMIMTQLSKLGPPSGNKPPKCEIWEDLSWAKCQFFLFSPIWIYNYQIIFKNLIIGLRTHILTLFSGLPIRQNCPI